MGMGPFEALYSPNVSSERFQAALNKLSPLVKLDHIKAHLLLIGAFREALEKVDKFTGSFEPTDALCSYLSRGVHRLHAWLTYVIRPSTDRLAIQPQELPPLDVFLLLHAYMLRPHRFYEASITTYRQLFAMGSFPLHQAAALINPDTFEYNPTQEQKFHWEQCTGIPFDPNVYKHEVADVDITCPFCKALFKVPWENRGSGYGERGFSDICSSCRSTVTQDNLCVAIFLEEIKAVTELDSAVISGTLLDNRGEVTLPRARFIALEVVKAICNKDGLIPSVVDQSMNSLTAQLCNAKDTKLRCDRIPFLLRPFAHATPFRYDLIRAVILQRKINSDLWAAGMCNKAYLSGPCVELQTACCRFNVFLEMAAHAKHRRVVPADDVDLIWHTLQLQGLSYRDSVIGLVGIYLDHMNNEEDPGGHHFAMNTSFVRLEEMFMDRGLVSLPVMFKQLGCGPSMTQDFLIDDFVESDA